MRALAYGLAGCAVESVFTSVLSRRREGRLRAAGPSTPWMLPIYGLGASLFEPVHDRLRARAAWQRLHDRLGRA